MSLQQRCVVVLVTCPNIVVARRIARQVITQQVAACVNVVDHVESVFRWRGKVERCHEVLLIIKTTTQRCESLRRMILSLHPYKVPEVIALPIQQGHPAYLRWIAESVEKRVDKPQV